VVDPLTVQFFGRYKPRSLPSALSVYTTTWPAPISTTWDDEAKNNGPTNYEPRRNTNSQTIYTYSPIVDNWQPNAEDRPSATNPSPKSSVRLLRTTNRWLLLETSPAKRAWPKRGACSVSQSYGPFRQTGKPSKNHLVLQTPASLEYRARLLRLPHREPPFLAQTVTSYATSNQHGRIPCDWNQTSERDRFIQTAAKNQTVSPETDYTYDSPAGTVTSQESWAAQRAAAIAVNISPAPGPNWPSINFRLETSPTKFHQTTTTGQRLFHEPESLEANYPPTYFLRR